jgi:hypothetical protein
MGIFGPSRGSIGAVVKAKVKAGQPHGGGAATQVQARQAKSRKKQIKEAATQRAQDAADIRRAKMLSFNGPPNAGKANKFNQKAIAKGDARRLKKEIKKEIKKAERKAKGFWG